MKKLSFQKRFCSNRNRRSSRSRRVLLAALVAGASLIATDSSATQSGPDQSHGGISILVHQFDAEAAKKNENEQAVVKDSGPAATASVAAHRTSSDFNQLIAAAVSASAARAGISVQQFRDPVAMVGPIESAPLATTTLGTPPAAEKDVIAAQDVPVETDAAQAVAADRQLAHVVAPNSWWQDDPCRMPYYSEFAELFETEAVDSDVSEVASIQVAAQQPNDVQSAEVASLVGSGPIITTIPEAYAPYDLAERDLKFLHLPLTTVAPIKSKNYVTTAEQVAATEPTIKISPDCLLDEVIHGAANLIERTRVTDLTFASLGESFGDWFADLAPTPSQTPEAIEIVAAEIEASEEAACELMEIIAMEVGSSVISASVAEAAPGAAPQEKLAATEIDATEIDATEIDATEIAASEEVACELMEIIAMEVGSGVISAAVADAAPDAAPQEQLAAVEIEAIEEVAPEAIELAVSEIATMEVDDEVIPAPVADAAPQEQLAAAEIEAIEEAAAEAIELAVSEIAMMEVEGEVIPAPVADAAPDAAPQEKLAAAEIEAIEEVAPEASELAASELATMEVDGEVIPAPVADAAPDAEKTQQVVSHESDQPAIESIADAGLELLVPGTDLSLSAMFAAIDQWQKETVAAILAAEQAAAKIAERTDAENDNVLR